MISLLKKIQFFDRSLIATSLAFMLMCTLKVEAQTSEYCKTDSIFLTSVGDGWAHNSINTVIFRQNSITTFKGVQYLGYYDKEGTVVLAKRNLGCKEWNRRETEFKADVKDAHNSISIGVDGNGILHMAWGLHGQSLNYASGSEPGSLNLKRRGEMTGIHEQAVTYPRFYRLAEGDLLFMYRQGQSGSGNIMLNRYEINSKQWTIVAHPLIDGEDERNAYMNTMAFDERGGWYISWTWRETWDVSTNHDIMYAYSPDQGESWRTSVGKAYTLPITQQNAEVVYEINQDSELINQTSMTLDSNGNPVIASYWKSKGSVSPQYHILYQQDSTWNARRVSERKTPFSLSGGGTKRIPISRPQIVAGNQHDLYMIYRDAERGNGITIASSSDSAYSNWTYKDIYPRSVGQWEPTLDRQAWKAHQKLYLLVQQVGQGDGETLQEVKPTPVKVLRCNPLIYRKIEH